MALVRNRQLVTDDPWVFVADDQPVPPAGDVVVGLARFLEERDALRRHDGKLGVRVEPTDEVTELSGELDGVSLIAVSFPKFSDGRGYTKARLLRERLGYAGELRAVGDVLGDQLYYMQRCGIDTFALKEGKDPAKAIACLDDLSVAYQGAADDPRPLYRRGR